MLTVARMDLDGPTSPNALVTKILKAEPGLSLPIPIEDIARQLDILEIRDIAADGFVGGLITDTSRSNGFVLVKQGLQPERRRFTIGHELGHFLMMHHRPSSDGFRCTSADMTRGRTRGFEKMSQAERWEVEANEFSSLLLMPPPMWRKEMQRYRDPDLAQIAELATRFEVSREAAARTYAKYHDEPVAIVMVKDGVVKYAYRDAARFPALAVTSGAPVPKQSIYHRAPRILVQPSDMVEANAGFWLQSDYGQRLPQLFEQVLFRQNGYAFILLWAELVIVEDYDADENRTSKERLADRQARLAR